MNDMKQDSTQPVLEFSEKYTRTNFITRRLIDGFYSAAKRLIGPLQLANVVEIGCGLGEIVSRCTAKQRFGFDREAGVIEWIGPTDAATFVALGDRDAAERTVTIEAGHQRGP